MKNNQTQDYDDDISFNVVDKNKQFKVDDSSYLRNTNEISLEDAEILKKIENKKQQQYFDEQHQKDIEYINNDLHLDNHSKRYTLNIEDKTSNKKFALPFISILFLLGLSIWLIVSAPSLPRAGVANGKYYIFEDYQKSLELQRLSQTLTASKKDKQQKVEKNTSDNPLKETKVNIK